MCLGRFSIELNMRKVIKRKLKQTNEQAERTNKKDHISMNSRDRATKNTNEIDDKDTLKRWQTG